jgi:hypothetical protein
MKTTITAFCLAISFLGIGCGVPMEDGSDVASQQEELVTSGYCELDATGKQNGYCITGGSGPSLICSYTEGLSANCVVGKKGNEYGGNAAACRNQPGMGRAWNRTACTF